VEPFLESLAVREHFRGGRSVAGSAVATTPLTEWSLRFPKGTSSSVVGARQGPTFSDMTGLTQPWHIILILLIALMLFGGRRLPEIGRSLGTGMREFKDSITGHTPAEPSPQLAPPEATAPAPQPTEHDTA
jgi:sec-independent protein translocase protein TatA